MPVEGRGVRPDEATFIQRVRFPPRQGPASQRESSLGKRQKTGRVVRMKEPYGKGVANHPDPEPYAVSREAGGGAMARARIGWVLSSAIVIVGGADAVKAGGRQHSARRYARWAGTSRIRMPHACA